MLNQRLYSSFTRNVSEAIAPKAIGIEIGSQLLPPDQESSRLTPTALVDRLNRFIVGQEDAKKAVAVAFRNRWRRHRVKPESLKDEIQPKNILMIGPTGWLVLLLPVPFLPLYPPEHGAHALQWQDRNSPKACKAG